MDLTNNEIKELLENSNTITRFMDDDYSKEEINLAFEEIKKEICYNENSRVVCELSDYFSGREENEKELLSRNNTHCFGGCGNYIE